MNEALDAVFLGLLQHIARADDVRRIDVLGGVERQRGGGVHHHIGALHAFLQVFLVADVALQKFDLVAFRIIEINQVNTCDLGDAIL